MTPIYAECHGNRKQIENISVQPVIVTVIFSAIATVSVLSDIDIVFLAIQDNETTKTVLYNYLLFRKLYNYRKSFTTSQLLVTVSAETARVFILIIKSCSNKVLHRTLLEQVRVYNKAFSIYY